MHNRPLVVPKTLKKAVGDPGQARMVGKVLPVHVLGSSLVQDARVFVAPVLQMGDHKAGDVRGGGDQC